MFPKLTRSSFDPPPSDDWRADLDGPSPRRRKSAWQLPLLLMLGIFAYWMSIRPVESLVKWQTDFDAAKNTAKAKGVPLLVDFWANWCDPCKSLDARVFSSRELAAAISKKFIPVRVDVSDRKIGTPAAKLASRYTDPTTGELPLPSILIINPNDETVIRRASANDLASAKALLDFLNSTDKPR